MVPDAVAYVFRMSVTGHSSGALAGYYTKHITEWHQGLFLTTPKKCQGRALGKEACYQRNIYTVFKDMVSLWLLSLPWNKIL